MSMGQDVLIEEIAPGAEKLPDFRGESSWVVAKE